MTKISIIFCAILLGYAFYVQCESESESDIGFESDFSIPDINQSSSTDDESSSEEEEEEQQQEPLMPSDNERAPGSTEERDEEAVPPVIHEEFAQNITCPINCTLAGQNKFKDDREFVEYLARLKMSIRFQDQFKPENLQKFCNMHQYVKTCILECPDDKDKTLFMKSFSVENVCTDKRMLRTTAFNDAFNSKLQACTEQCSEFGDKIMQMNTKNLSPATMETIKTGCEYMLCFNRCERETLVATVGEDDAKYFERMMAQSIKFTRFSAENEKENLVLPEVCLQVEKLGMDFDDDAQVTGVNSGESSAEHSGSN